MYLKTMNDEDRVKLNQRYERIKSLQAQDICFGWYNFDSGDIFPDDGLIFYEDDLIRCQFEKYPRVNGQTIIVTREHYEDMSEMPLELGTYILSVIDKLIKLHKEILKAEKVYMCTICDGKRNHLHFQLFPRFKTDTIGYGNFVKPEGVLTDYQETVKLFKGRLEKMMVE